MFRLNGHVQLPSADRLRPPLRCIVHSPAVPRNLQFSTCKRRQSSRPLPAWISTKRPYSSGANTRLCQVTTGIALVELDHAQDTSAVRPTNLLSRWRRVSQRTQCPTRSSGVGFAAHGAHRRSATRIASAPAAQLPGRKAATDDHPIGPRAARHQNVDDPKSLRRSVRSHACWKADDVGVTDDRSQCRPVRVPAATLLLRQLFESLFW
ncbi:hypothetical protein ACVILK_003177 [Bradyrhizobium embrapense]